MTRWLTRIASRWLSKQPRHRDRYVSKAIAMAHQMGRADLVARLEGIKQ